MEIALCGAPRDHEITAQLARIAEEGGVSRLGLADSPVLFQDVHGALQGAVRATSTLKVGTFVTNPITRHWSVQAAALRTLDQLAPGRTFMGIGPGDSAVHSIGLAPAKPDELAAYVRAVREHLPSSLEVLVAAGGPRGVAAGAAYADGIVLGQGVSRQAIHELSRIADEATRPSGAAPVRKWLFLVFNLAETPSDIPAAAADIRSTVVAFSRNAFDQTFKAKAVDSELGERLRALYRDYTFEEHSVPGASRNALLLEQHERRDVEEFLFARFAIADVPEVAAERLEQLAAELGIDRFFLCIEASNPVALVRLMADRMLPRLL